MSLSVFRRHLFPNRLTQRLSRSICPSPFAVALGLSIALVLLGIAPALSQSDIGRLEQKLNKLMQSADYAAALPVARRVVSLAKKRFGRDSRSYSAALNNLANVHYNLSEFGKAEKFYRESFEINEKLLGRNHPTTAQSIVNLATALMRQQRLREAKALVLEAASIFESTGDKATAQALHAYQTLGIIAFYEGDYSQSSAYYEKALSGYTAAYGGTHDRIAEVLGAMAINEDKLGRYEKAIELHERQIAVLEKIKRPDHPDIGTALHQLAGSYLAQGKYAKALPLYERALEILTNGLGERNDRVAHVLTAMVSAYGNVGEFKKAKTAFDRATAIIEATVGPRHPFLASVLENYAAQLVDRRRFKEAAPLLKRAMEIWVATYGEKHYRVAEAMAKQGALLGSAGRYHEAEQLFQEALKRKMAILGETHGDIAELLRNLGLSAERQGHIEEAFQYHRRSARIRARLYSEQGGLAGRDERSFEQRRAFLNLVQIAWRAKQTHSTRIPAGEISDAAFKAIQVAHQSSSARALAQLAARLGAGQTRLATMVRHYQDLNETERSLQARYLKAYGEKSPQQSDAGKISRQLQEVRAERARLASDIERKFPHFADFVNPHPLSIAETQKLLKANEALFLISSWQQTQLIWVVTREERRWYGTDLTGTELATMVADLRKSLDLSASAAGQASPFNLQTAFDIYRHLFAPAEDLIAGKKQLLVSVDGPLTSLPLHLLVTEKPPVAQPGADGLRSAAWLARKFAVTTLPSVSSLRALRVDAKASSAPMPMMGYGNPVFSPNKHRRDTRGAARSKRSPTSPIASYFRGAAANLDVLRNGLPPLPETAYELKAVAASLGANRSKIVLGPRATERRVKSAKLDRYRIIYFATHALVAGEVAGLAEPSLVLTLPKVPDTVDDGLLTASEVAELKLDSDAVILSACNTAAGDKPGAEALSGLARAFLYAGARSLLVSHWPVDSAAAVRLTTRLFSELSRAPDIGRSEALRRAMVEFMDDRSDPLNSDPGVWAPFVIVGEGGARK